MAFRVRNYVGVSGVATVEEAEKVVEAFGACTNFGKNWAYAPMIGFQVSYKSLEYGYSEGNIRVPRLDALPGILKAVEGKVFTTLHYYTKSEAGLLREIGKLMNTGGGIYYRVLVGGLQINGVLPSPKRIESIKSAFPELKLTLQLSPKSIGSAPVEDVARRLAREYPTIDYVLIDSSMGAGKEIDTGNAADIYQTLRDNKVESRIVFAGGLNGDNVSDKIEDIAGRIGTNDFSIDAEGGLRDRVGEGYGNDRLNMEKVRTYLRSASRALDANASRTDAKTR